MNNYFKNSDSTEMSCDYGNSKAVNVRLRLDLGHQHQKLSWKRFQYSPLPSEVQLGERASLCSRGSKLRHHCNSSDGMLAASLAGEGVIVSLGLNGTASLNEVCQAHPLSSVFFMGGRGALERSKDSMNAEDTNEKERMKIILPSPNENCPNLSVKSEGNHSGVSGQTCTECGEPAWMGTRRCPATKCFTHFACVCSECGHEAFWLTTRKHPAGRWVCFSLLCDWVSTKYTRPLVRDEDGKPIRQQTPHHNI